jgi:Histidine phosphatase superfamily (branch 2)
LHSWFCFVVSQLGLEQTEELGRFLRDRYDGFVGGIYDQDEISVLSSATDRAIRSGLSILRGLFPPIGLRHISHDGFSCSHESQIVPLRTIPKEFDDVSQSTFSCKSHFKLSIINPGKQVQIKIQ